MKSKPLFCISTLAALVLGASYLGSATTLASAEPVSDTEAGQTSWTFDELAAISDQMLAELDSVCADSEDWNCEMDFFVERGETDPLYRAYDSFYHGRFFVTAVNLMEDTMRVYFRDHNLSDRSVTPEPEYLKGLYIARYDAGYFPWDRNLEQIVRAGGEPKTHVIYADWDDTFAEETLLPANQEVTLSAAPIVADPAIEDQLVYYAVVHRYGDYAYYYGLSNTFEFGDCLASGYQEGVECRLTFSDTGISYQVYAIEEESATPDSPEIEEPALTPELSTPESSVSKIPASSGASTSSVATFSSSAIATDDTTTPNLDATSPTASDVVSSATSDTMATPLGGNESARELPAEFPFWLLAIILPGLGLLIWWFFLPLGKKRKSEERH